MSLFATPSDVKKTKPTYLSYEGVGNCCGVGWLCNFPIPVKYPRTDIQKTDKDIIKAVESDMALLDNKRYSIQLAVLTNKQTPYWDELLKKYGYKPLVKDKYHTYAGNLLTLYCKVRYEKNKSGHYIDTCGMDAGNPYDFEDDEDFN